MDSKQFSELLTRLHACADAQAFAEGKSLKKVWETCDRADWLLWLAGRMVGVEGWPTREQIALAACDCAETALKFVPKGEERPRKCIETVRAWAVGNATIEEVREARRADAAAYAAYAAAADAAADAAYAAAADADAAADAAAYAAAADAAYAAAAAAYAAYAAYAAAYAAYAAYAARRSVFNFGDARKKALKKMAGIVRKALSVPTKGTK